MKKLYTLCMMLFMGLTLNAQTLISETTEQLDNLIVTTKNYDNGSTEYHLRTEQAVVTDLTAWLVSMAPCGFSGGCETIILGCCFGDGLDHPDSTGCEFPEFQEYTCQVDLELVWNTFRLEHCTFTMLNGTSIINNGIDIVESTFCDVNDEVTEYIFEGGGLEFADRAAFDAYQETLNIDYFELFKQNANKDYFTLDGKQIKNLDFVPNGVYLIKYELEGRIEVEKTIKK